MAKKKLIDLYPYRLKKNKVEFLLLKRSTGEKYESQWRMIGGKVEESETHWEAALRELDEETGMRPSKLWTIPSLNHFYEWSTDEILLIPAFAAEIRDYKSLTLEKEHRTASWFTIKKATNLIIWPEQKRLLKLLNKIVISNQILDDWHVSQN